VGGFCLRRVVYHRMQSNYLVSLDEEDMAKQSGNYYGKVKSNFIGTEFICFDKGAKPA
jgi:tubby-related protein 1